MPYTFPQAKYAFKDNRIRELSLDSEGLRFLKLRSLSRAEYLQRLMNDSGFENLGIRGDALLEYIFNSDIGIGQIESTIRSIYTEERQERRQHEDELISELYRLESFDWGGLHQNSLERTIVDNYVKRICSYDRLSDCIENEIQSSMRGYVQCSWYNHWTSIVIEDIFRDHPSVLPAVGLIKKVDFFISDVPFDLKVTYLPEGYIKDRRRAEGLRPELTLLKQACRQNRIAFDRSMPASKLAEDLWKKTEDCPSESARVLLRELRDFRLSIVQQTIDNPEHIIRWLYENQGVRRFDASNRLFLILIDTQNFFNSWKLKRAKPLLVDNIHAHLDRIRDNPGQEIVFDWEGEQYTTTSEAIVITHSRNAT